MWVGVGPVYTPPEASFEAVPVDQAAGASALFLLATLAYAGTAPSSRPIIHTCQMIPQLVESVRKSNREAITVEDDLSQGHMNEGTGPTSRLVN